MKIHDTLSGSKKSFEPSLDKVRMYVCGITPYSSAHVGHAMSAIVFDVIRRYLEFKGYEVIHIQNFTDVDDKLIDRSAKENESVEVISERYIQEYIESLRTLNIKPAANYPRATMEIPSMIEFIEVLISKEFAYEVNGDVYFRVTKDPDYGKLSRRNLDSMRSSVGVEGLEKKEHPMDFSLWKTAKPGEPSWQSPWGLGRPGWHIECSAMAFNYLGKTIDIHGGGQDLVFPHHENEIAQSQAYNQGEPLSKFWMHNGMMLFEDEKMSKSLGNLVTIDSAIKKHSANALRYLILSSHYRSPATYSEELMTSAGRAFQRLSNAISAKPGEGAVLESTSFKENVLSAMDDDFNTPQALAAMFDFVREINSGISLGNNTSNAQAELLGIAENIFGFTFSEPKVEIPDDLISKIETLIAKRENFRAIKEFSQADQIRDELSEMGIELTDSHAGSNWKFKGKN